MPPPVTGKQRAARIPLDYYKKSDLLGRWKTVLGWAALLAPSLWLGVGFGMSGQGDFHASRGPVSSVHQIWDASCSTCHTNFTPISSNAFQVPLILGDAKDSSNKCRTCHAGPDHFKGQPDDRTCASCHREHRGPDASLISLQDSDCTQCHRNIKAHGAKEFNIDVTHFAKSAHPEFRSIKTDPGKLKFNHQQHLRAGQPKIGKDGQTGGALKFLKDLPKQHQERYRSQQANKADDAPVQLQCASCHQLDSGDFGVTSERAKEFPFGITGNRSGGSYMQPILYENQCQACHPLTLDHKVAGDKKSDEFAVPHRLQPKEIHDLLENFFTARFARGQAGFLEKKVVRPLPGKLPGLLDRTIGTEITKEVRLAENSLYQAKLGCANCHYFDGKNAVEPIKMGEVPDLYVTPTNVPSVWYKHAKFNHTAHRAVNCKDCHANAETSTSASAVMIPNMDNCVKCHAPKAGHVGGARHNCTECHQYHHGEQSLQGVGAARRNPGKLHKIDDFLLIK